jgi:hypothetical protein
MTKRLLLLAFIFSSAFGCTEKAAKSYLAPFAPEKSITDGNASDVFDPKADILFVIDNSGSMDTHQRNLIRNIDLFVSAFLKTSIIDYNIGVITTDTEGYAQPCCGKLVGGNYRFVNKSTPNTNNVLKQNLLVGTSGSGYEMPFNAISLALDPSMMTGYNTGFIRKGAALTVIFITDAEDQSQRVSSNDLLAKLLALKNGDKTKVLGYGAIVPTGVTNCDRDDYSVTPRKIEEFLNIVPNGGGGKNVVSLCANDYGQRLADFALQIVDQISSQIFLTRLPDVNSLQVFYGNSELPRDVRKGWAYSPELNAVLLGDQIDWASQPVGSKVEVRYKEARGSL